MWGFARFTTFTVWCWTLQGVYFTLSSCAYFLHTPDAAPGGFSLLGAAALVLYEVNLATSILVTVVVSFVLFPEVRFSTASSPPAFRAGLFIGFPG